MNKLICTAIAALACASAAAQEVPEDFRDKLSSLLGERMPIESIANTPIPGVFEVTAGGRVLYAASSDELLMVGSLYDVERGVNVGEEKQNEVASRKAEEELGPLSVDDMVVFKGEETKRHITVFTDVECGYCRRLHQEVPILNEAGVEIRYMLYPVISERSYPNAESVWCADDRQTAMTQAKQGKPIEHRECANPIEQHMQIASKLGVRGTPFLVLDDYTVIPGYVPADNLIEQLGL